MPSNTLLPNINTRTWTIKELHEKRKQMLKDKFQRRMRWLKKRREKSPKMASMREYIDFLVSYRNSQIPIALGQFIRDNQIKFSVSDGNNRIHAIINVLENPYILYDELFENLIEHVKNINGIDDEKKEQFIKMVKKLTYKEIRTETWREKIGEKFMKDIEDAISGTAARALTKLFRELKQKFCFGKGDQFDLTSDIAIVVNIFENFTYEQLSQNYQDVHSKAQSMDEFDLLAASLGCYEITVPNKELELKLKDVITEYYNERNRDDELLEQYNVDADFKWTAFDFLLSFQEYCCEKYNIFKHIQFDKPITVVPLIFRLFKIFFNDSQLKKELFTPENIELFIKKCETGFERLQTIVTEMYPNLNNDNKVSVFKTRENSGKFKGIPILALTSILSSDMYEDTPSNKKKIKCIIHYNRFVKQISVPKDNEAVLKAKEGFKILDVLDSQRNEYKNTDRFLNDKHNNPSGFLSHAPTKAQFKKIIQYIVNTEIKKKQLNPLDGRSGKKRTQISYTNFILMNHLWKITQTLAVHQKILEDGIKMHDDHLIPWRTQFAIKLTLDRLGNLSPIMGNVNSGRGNGHIKYYWDNEEIAEKIKRLGIFPSVDDYNQIVEYIKSGSNTICKIKNVQRYNYMCKENEERYISEFVKSLYPEN
jgi:hypothetical protein